MPLFNRRNKAGSAAGEQVHIGHTDPFNPPASSRPSGPDPFVTEHPLTAHLNAVDAGRVAAGGKSFKPAGGFGTDPGALFRRKR